MTDQPDTGGNVPSNHPCPNCGYCPHCGRSNQPKFVPAPWVYPTTVRPPYYQPYTVWSQSSGSIGGNTTVWNTAGGSYR